MDRPEGHEGVVGSHKPGSTLVRIVRRRRSAAGRSRGAKVLLAAVCGVAAVAGMAACAAPEVSNQPVGEITVSGVPAATGGPQNAEQRQGTVQATTTGVLSGGFGGTATCARTSDIDGSTLLTYGLELNAGKGIAADFSFKPSTGVATGTFDDGNTGSAAYALTAASAVDLPTDLSGGSFDATFRPISGASGDINLVATLTCSAADERVSATPPAITPGPTYIAPRSGYSTVVSSGADAVYTSKVLNATCGVWSQPDGTWVATYNGVAPEGSDEVWFNLQQNLATGQLTGKVIDQRRPGAPVTLALNPSVPTVTANHMRVAVLTGYTVASGVPSKDAATPTVTQSSAPVLSGNRVYLYVDCMPQTTASPSQ